MSVIQASLMRGVCSYSNTNLQKDGHSHVRLAALFIVPTSKYNKRCFFYEILILIKSKNIIVFYFQIITNQTNHDYLFQ